MEYYLGDKNLEKDDFFRNQVLNDKKEGDMDIASAMMSINAVKGVNIGSGMNSAQLSGEQNSDEISQKGKKLKFDSNNAGGILGGISTGQEIVVSFAVKPTSSILTTRKTINKFGKNTTISVKGRHDPCVGIRADDPLAETVLYPQW